jgi:nitrite reductase (NADH) small subunit
MTREITLGGVDQIPLGEGRTFAAGDKQIAVFRTRAGGVYAVQALCPHRGGPLADGLVGDFTVVCPLHERTFDLRTGTGVGCEDSVRRFSVRLDENGWMYVSVQS